jgi:arylamine N-acetyltransferase
MTSAYSAAQIERFLSLIELPSKYYPSNNPVLDEALLNRLHVHMVSTVPYENLGLHYDTSTSFWKLSLDPADLYQKIVVNGRGRGG